MQPIELVRPLTRGICAYVATLLCRVRVVPRDTMANALRPRVQVLHTIPALHRGRRPLLGDEDVVL